MRQRMLLLLAVIFGLLAFVLTYQQIEAEKRRIAGDSETAILIQVTRNMVEGETLTEKDVARYTVRRRREAMANSREIPWSQLYKVVNHKLDTSAATATTKIMQANTSTHILNVRLSSSKLPRPIS